jgi:hypothetical protein
MDEARERRAGLGWNSELTAADSVVEAVPNPFVEKLQARINRVTASPWVSSRAPDSPLNARSQAYAARSLAAAKVEGGLTIREMRRPRAAAV